MIFRPIGLRSVLGDMYHQHYLRGHYVTPKIAKHTQIPKDVRRYIDIYLDTYHLGMLLSKCAHDLSPRRPPYILYIYMSKYVYLSVPLPLLSIIYRALFPAPDFMLAKRNSASSSSSLSAGAPASPDFFGCPWDLSFFFGASLVVTWKQGDVCVYM